ncbi:putative protein of unknown function (DUF4449) [Lyophyllum shimeji]|uniref:Uncharacterized protein n=1 Tax=Lyophyllum shimeji TaxID=47721 RepID=A0A9P3PU84_LYOSH|nr:putative protein of unknown function (DUF4449) [Lyophyllum shimeji]
MEKAADIVAALDAGKLPTTQQFCGFIDWLDRVGIASVEPAATDDLSAQGRLLAKRVREVLDAYKQLALDKDGDNILQEAIWHLTQGEIQPSAEVTDQATADINALRSSLRTLLSVVWGSLSSEGGNLLNDFASFTRLSLADAAELVESGAGTAKEGLRDIEQGVQSGQRMPVSGRDKKRVEEEQADAKAKWDHSMDTVKEAGDTVIDTTRKATAAAEEKKERLTSKAQEAYLRMCDRAVSDPQYREAVNTILTVLQQRTHQTLEATKNQPLSSFIHDPTPEQHVPQALDLFQKFFERLSNMSFNPLFSKLRECCNMIADDPELRKWFDDFFDLARKNLIIEGYARSEESKNKRKELRERWKMLLMEKKNEQWKNTVEEVNNELQKIQQGLEADQDLQRVRAAHAQLSEDLERGLIVASEKAQTGMEALMERATWFWQDLFRVYIPRILQSLRDIPIPRTEYKDAEIEFVLENLDISSLNLLPSHVYIRNITDVEINAPAEQGAAPRTGLGTLTRIKVDAVQLELKDVSFWYRDLAASGLSPKELTGRLKLTLPPQGVSLDVKVGLIPDNLPASDPKSRVARGHFHDVEYVKVSISDDVSMEVKESNHGVLLTMFKPIFVMRLREALEKTMAEQVRAAIEWADGIAWDVGRRREVFEDMGVVGGGPAMIAAVWSELGRLRREGKHTGVEWKATGTGVVVEQKKGDVKFAMGAEPQILSGEKKGPLGTASEPIGRKVEEVAQERLGVDVQVPERPEEMRAKAEEMTARAKGIAEESQRKAKTFKRAVEMKAQQEKKKPGWQSDAFNI